jgi:hypothetical protein
MESENVVQRKKATVCKINIRGTEYLLNKDGSNMLYHSETREEMGIWNAETKTIEELPEEYFEYEENPLTLTRGIFNGREYFKDEMGFLYKVKNDEQKLLAKMLINIDDNQLILKKRVTLIFTNKNGGKMDIITNITTLYRLLGTYETYHKKTLLSLYKDALKLISNYDETAESILITDFRNYAVAMRSVIILRFILAKSPLPITHIRCGYCYKKDIKSTFKKCGCCKKVYYCSSECNKMGWIEHKHMCKQLASIGNWW